MSRSVLPVLAVLLVCGSAPVHGNELTIWKCKEATAEMPGKIRQFETQFNAILKWPPSQKKASHMGGAYFGFLQAQSLVDSYSWHCGWGGEGKAAAKDMKARLAGMKAHFDALLAAAKAAPQKAGR